MSLMNLRELGEGGMGEWEKGGMGEKENLRKVCARDT